MFHVEPVKTVYARWVLQVPGLEAWDVVVGPEGDAPEPDAEVKFAINDDLTLSREGLIQYYNFIGAILTDTEA